LGDFEGYHAHPGGACDYQYCRDTISPRAVRVDCTAARAQASHLSTYHDTRAARNAKGERRRNAADVPSAVIASSLTRQDAQARRAIIAKLRAQKPSGSAW